MSARASGRRTESLFDNRYRYDHIYPRGRSGETLRAYDTADHDRPVVVKRPAPQDAPPMRAGQEVSIRNERQALERLSGHAVLTELRGSGTFRVGGHTYEYIVMDLAQGEIVEDLVLDLASRSALLPELETLVIMDRLLDLLAFAHEHDVIYNDVDAKHLFWNRETYQLKVIDWGNAVFLDEPGASPGVTRASDIFQCGELLYFILTGGNRLATDGSEDESFFVNFGTYADRVPARLQTIVTRAVHPDLKRRYRTINDLRQALAEHRAPLEKSRDEIVARVRKRVRPTASQEELEELADALQLALDMDPGYPESRSLAADIYGYLNQIEIQADLDAIRIYLESGNWPRAIGLLQDLLPRAAKDSQPLIRFLIAAAAMLDGLQLPAAPDGLLDALDPLLRGDGETAAQALLLKADRVSPAGEAQWLLAEQLATLMPGIDLLRPHLVRLRRDLMDMPEARDLLVTLDEIEDLLDHGGGQNLTRLVVIYQHVESRLAQVEDRLEALPAGDDDLRETMLASVIRAHRAAHHIVERLQEVGEYVYRDPRHAGDLLRKAAAIDPTSVSFEALHDYFDEVHQAIEALGQFKPKGDGANLAGWFEDVQAFLQPYLDDLADPAFQGAVNALHRAAGGWRTAVNYLALGRRQPTVDELHGAADLLRPYNEHVAAWMGTLTSRLPDAAFVERFSPNGPLADALIEGWKAWDAGDAARAAALGQQAYDAAMTSGEQLAADRLRRLGELLEQWVKGDGLHDSEVTDRAETNVLSVLLSDEEQERRTFAEQMPSTTLYLRTMSRGIVAYMHQSSSAGWRALYLHYVLRGALALNAAEIEEAEFWRDVASKAFDGARTHRAFQLLDRAVTGYRLMQSVERAFNAPQGPEHVDELRHAVNQPLAGELLTGAEQSVQAVADALRDWSDGNFGAARAALDRALEQINIAISKGNLNIAPYVDWVTRLRDRAAELQQARMVIDQRAMSPQPEPDPAVTEAHRKIVDLSTATLGVEYAHQVRQWNEMYRVVLATYTSDQSRREKLAAFGRHFSSLFITKHPAYPLFRHWEGLIEELPVDEPEPVTPEAAPDTSEPTLLDEETLTFYDDEEPQPKRRKRAKPPKEAPAPVEEAAAPERDAAPSEDHDLPWNWIIAIAAVVLMIAVGYAISRAVGRDDVATEPTVPAAGVAAAPSATPAPTDLPPTETTLPPTEVVPTRTLEAVALPAVATAMPTTLPTTAAPSDTPVPTEPPPTATPAPTDTPQPVGTVTATPISVASRPSTSVLDALEGIDPAAQTWSDNALVPGEDGVWLLSTASSGDEVSIDLTPDLLNTLFRAGTANSLARADVTFELQSPDPAALAGGSIAFGLGLANAQEQRTIGEVQLGADVIDLGLNQAGQFRSRTQLPAQAGPIELSVRRTNETTFSFYVDGKLLGDSVMLFAEGQPVTLILYASGPNVVVRVTDFNIDAVPRGELP
jgi:serine/threonine protein kinase